MRGLTIAFDLDGTLVDTAPDLVGATNHVLRGLGGEPMPEAALRPWISFGARRMIVEALAHRRIALTETEVDRQLTIFLDHYAANIARSSRPFPGALDVLGRFIAEGAILTVCTNKRESLSRLLLEQLGMSAMFRTVAGRDTFPVCKPDPGHLTGAIRLAGGDIQRAIMVGDSGVDIATARSAGIPVVGVTFGYTDIPVADLGPDAVIEHYSELDCAIRNLDGSVTRPPRSLV